MSSIIKTGKCTSCTGKGVVDESDPLYVANCSMCGGTGERFMQDLNRVRRMMRYGRSETLALAQAFDSFLELVFSVVPSEEVATIFFGLDAYATLARHSSFMTRHHLPKTQRYAGVNTEYRYTARGVEYEVRPSASGGRAGRDVGLVMKDGSTRWLFKSDSTTLEALRAEYDRQWRPFLMKDVIEAVKTLEAHNAPKDADGNYYRFETPCEEPKKSDGG